MPLALSTAICGGTGRSEDYNLKDRIGIESINGIDCLAGRVSLFLIVLQGKA